MFTEGTTAMCRVGEPAPSFELTDQHGRAVRSAELVGTRIMLVFLPLAFSGVCGSELARLDEGAALFSRADTQVFGITVDSMFALRAWSDAAGTSIRLLSDFWPHGGVAQRFDAFNSSTGRATRTSVAIDGNGMIVDCFSAPDDAARPMERYGRAIERFEERV